MRHDIVDDQYGKTVLVVLRSKEPAAQQWDAERAKVIVRCAVKARRGLMVELGRFALDVETADVFVVAGPGKIAAEASTGNTRNRLQHGKQPVVEREELIVLRIVLNRQ